MARETGTHYRRVPLTLTVAQDERIRAMQAERQSEIRRVSYAEVVRELIELGFAAIDARDGDGVPSGNTAR